MILSILVSLSIMILNPVAQIQKGQDAQRQHDLKQIVTGLDSYFNDKNSYPQDITVLVSNKNIQAIPSDPAATAGSNYAYIYDGQNNVPPSATPQWNVLFARLALPSSSNSSFSCPLLKMRDSGANVCVPKNYASLGYNYCVISGSVICDMITATTIVPLPITQAAGSTPTPPIQGNCVCGAAGFYKDPNISDPKHQCQIYDSTQGVHPNSELYCISNNGVCEQLCRP
jgi:type II secretory pathway pseudopilin PulG